MRLEDFKANKILIKRTMQMNMARALENGSSPFDYCYLEDNKVITIKFEDKVEAIKGKMKFVSDCMQAGRDVSINGITHTPYCSTYTIGTSYTIEGRKLREYIADYQITNKMKKFVTDKIRVAIDNEYKQLDCKVMDLYKSGIINWNDVIVSHGKECSL